MKTYGKVKEYENENEELKYESITFSATPEAATRKPTASIIKVTASKNALYQFSLKPVHLTQRKLNFASESSGSSRKRNRESSPSTVPVPGASVTGTKPHTHKKLSNNSEKVQKEQLFIDLGHKSFGRRSQCKKCGMIWVEGDPGDEAQHIKFCSVASSGVPFSGWKKERVIASWPSSGRDSEARVIEIRHGDSTSHLAKLNDVKVEMDKDMGYTHSPMKIGRRAFLYVTLRTIASCVITEVISDAHHIQYSETCRERMAKEGDESSIYDFESNFESLPNGCMESCGKKVPARIGVHQMWTHPRFRRKGIMLKLLDAVRQKMIFGMVIDRNLVAFSQPTEDGIRFARSYINAADKNRSADYSAGDIKPLVYDISCD